MIINNITIENFRCYYGTNTIELNSNGKITLIYGDSGYGKSSLLQFFRWMFYGDPDFGPNNDKPLFNLQAYKNCKAGERVKVFGRVDFTHLGVRYSLSKTAYYSFALNPNNSRLEDTEYTLQHLVGDNWQRYAGDVTNKINTILPKGLSKYFFLDGERARDIVLNSKDLRSAIHQLFGLDAYANASSHLGNKNKKNSVLGYYQSELTKNTASIQAINNLSLAEAQEALSDIYDKIEIDKEDRKKIIAEIDAYKARRDEIFKILGQANNKSSIQQLIQLNEDAIKKDDEKIASLKRKIGDLFYSCYPYLFLSRMTTKSSALLRAKNQVFAQSNTTVFENLQKALLKEIVDKGVCVCGRELDEHAHEHLENIMAVMPPNSYHYLFGQFVTMSKNKIATAQTEIRNYESYQAQIEACEQDKEKLEESIQDRYTELKRLEDAKDLVTELEEIDEEIKSLERRKAGLEGDITKRKFVYTQTQNQIDALTKKSANLAYYNKRLEFFSRINLALEQEKKHQEARVQAVLDDCVRQVFKQLTTQTELDVDSIKFVNNDFSLRTTYLTGGQLAVDEYSYVIGIIKALQEMKMENNENPIVIDAPFAFTGTSQSEHIFKTLPLVSKQTVLMTLDLAKIKNLLGNTELYDFYVIKNQSQESATIERGDINDFKF